MMIKKRIAELDGLRSIAVILVILFHINFYYGYVPVINEIIINGGNLGVMIFFFLSGFLMASAYIESTENEHILYPTGLFYLSRFLRILPLLFFTSFIIILTRKYNHLNTGMSSEYSSFEIIKCLVLFDTRIFRLNPVLWTLKIELIFYCIFPLIGVLIHYAIIKKKIIFIILFLIVLIAFSFYKSFLDPKNNGFMEKCHLLLIGSLLRIFQFNYKKSIEYFSKTSWLYISILLITLFINFLYLKEEEVVLQILLMFFVSLLFIFSLHQKGIPGMILSSQIFSQISKISYGLYLWHFVIYYMIAEPLTKGITRKIVLNTVLGHSLEIFLICLLSSITYRWIEKPIMDLKKSKLFAFK